MKTKVLLTLLLVLMLLCAYVAITVDEWTRKKAALGTLAMAALGGGLGMLESRELAFFGAVSWGLGGIFVFGRASEN